MTRFWPSFLTEIIKIKNSFAKWLILLGAFIMPAFVAFVALNKWKLLVKEIHDNPWALFSEMSWKGMAFFYSVFFIVLLVCLYFNIEYKNNTWKHVFTLPIKKGQLYINKLLAVVVFVVCYYILFVPFWIIIGYLLGAIRPQLQLITHMPDLELLFSNCFHSVISSLSIIAIHIWLSIRFKNMIIPIGFAVFCSIVMVALFQGSSEEVRYFPYAYHYLSISTPPFFHESKWGPLPQHEWYSLGFFFVFTMLGYWDFTRKFSGNG